MPETSAKNRHDAFVSHASEQDALATRIGSHLAKQGVSVWVDHHNLRRKGLLLEALQQAIERCRHVVLLWSKDSATSRYVTAEWNFAWNRELPVIPCRMDEQKLPLGLAGYLYCDFRASFAVGARQLRAALKGEAPAPAPVPHEAVSTPSGRRRAANRNELVRHIYARQNSLLGALERGDVAGANRVQRALDTQMDAAQRQFGDDADVQALAGYHLKNAYLLKHWQAVQARQSPGDPLLAQAEARFWEVLRMRPNDAGALNGLGSVLWLRGDLDAAEFYVKRSIERAREQGFSYPYAEQDLRNIRRQKAAQKKRPRATG